MLSLQLWNSLCTAAQDNGMLVPEEENSRNPVFLLSVCVCVSGGIWCMKQPYQNLRFACGHSKPTSPECMFTTLEAPSLMFPSNRIGILHHWRWIGNSSVHISFELFWLFGQIDNNIENRITHPHKELFYKFEHFYLGWWGAAGSLRYQPWNPAHPSCWLPAGSIFD